MEEVWKPVVGYEGYYEVSNYGRVKRLETRVNSNQGGRVVREKILRQTNNRGYCLAHLCVNNEKKKKRVHRMVAEAFIPNPLNLQEVNHKDENKKNNYVALFPDGTYDYENSNLEWCSAEYNNNYGSHQERSLQTRYEKYYKYSKAEEKRKSGKTGHWNPIVVYYKGEFFNRYNNPLIAEKDLLKYGVNRHAIYYVLRFNLEKDYNGFTIKREYNERNKIQEP